MEIQPTVTVNPATGEEVISYDQAVVIDHSYIDDAQREHRRQEENFAYYEDEDGLHSKWADALDRAEAEALQAAEEYEQRQYQQRQQQYEETDEEPVFYDGDDIATYIFSKQPEEYTNMVHWAAENLAEEFADWYDEQIDTGDVDTIIAAINRLTNLYNQYN